MKHSLTTEYAKSYCNRTLIVQVIVKNVVTSYFWDTVYFCCEDFPGDKNVFVYTCTWQRSTLFSYLHPFIWHS